MTSLIGLNLPWLVGYCLYCCRRKFVLFCAVFLFKRKYFNLRNLSIDMGGNFIINVVNRMINEICIHIGLCVHSWIHRIEYVDLHKLHKLHELHNLLNLHILYKLYNLHNWHKIHEYLIRIVSNNWIHI